MALLVIRSVAVYAVTGLVAAFLASRYVSRVPVRSALFLLLAPLLLVGRAMLTGGVYAPIDNTYQAPPLSRHAREMGTSVTQNPILGDVVYQEIPWRKAVREAVKNGRLPLWNRFILAGEPLLAVQQPVVFHPATWISFLLPLAQSWTFEMALRLFLAALCAYLFLRDVGCSELAALFGAFAWAFSDYLVFFLGYPLTPAVAPFPLLLLGLRRLTTAPGKGSVALTVIALLLIGTSGHPETLLHTVAAAGVYFLFELAGARESRGRAFVLSILAGALALGLLAVLLLPLLEALPHTAENLSRTRYYAHVTKSVPVPQAVRRLSVNLIPYSYGMPGKGETGPGSWEIAGYAGTLVWPFALLGMFSKIRAKWPLAALGLAGVLLEAHFPVITDGLSALPVFNIALNERLVFLAAFASAALAAFGLDWLMQQKNAARLALAAFGGLAVIALLFAIFRPHLLRLGMPRTDLRDRFLLQAIPLVLMGFAALVFGRRYLKSVAAAGVVLLILQRGFEERNVYPTYPNRAFYPPLRSLERIPRGVPERMTAVGFTFVPNISALYELEDVRGYEAMTFFPLFETYPLWCVHQAVWFNRVDDPTRPFLSFLNVRYVYAPPGYSPPPGWKVLFRGDEGLLLENPGSLARAFAPAHVSYEPDSERRLGLLWAIRDFSDAGVIGQGPPPGVARGQAQPNGHASVRTAAYQAGRMTLDIDANEPALIATSVTAWPGWKLTIDGAPAPLLPYNHAFLAFRSPPGRHTAILHYWPDSFTAGLAVSGAALVSCLVLLSLRRFEPAVRPRGESGRSPLDA